MKSHFKSLFNTSFLIAFLFISNALIGQKVLSDVSRYERNSLRIIRDTLWLKEQGWEIAQYLTPDKNPIYGIPTRVDPDKFDFKVVPFLKISKNGQSFIFGDDLLNFLEFDSTLVAAIILFNNERVGFISGFNYKNKWHYYPLEIFDKNNLVSQAFDKIFELKTDLIFCIKGVAGAFFILNDKEVLWSFNRKLEPFENYIKINPGIIKYLSSLPSGNY